MKETLISQTPRYSISEDDNQLELSIALPGVNKESIQLSTESYHLSLEAERKQPVDQESWNLISSTHEPEAYKLNLKINPEYDISLTEAKFEKNVLHLTIPSKAANERTLEIH